MEYELKTDSELITLSNGGDANATSAILNRYKNLVKSIARSLFLTGGDTEDLVQEGMIGLMKAVSSYNGKSPFKNYAFLCIKSSILSAIKVNNKKNNIPLNSYVSFTVINEGEGNGEIFVAGKDNPESFYIDKENVEELKTTIKKGLSEFEYEVLASYLGGLSFAELQEKFGKNRKSIENALNRIRKKIEKTLK